MRSARAAPVSLALAALLALGLGGCRPADRAGGMAKDLTAQVLFTAVGSYDAQADRRPRLGGGLRGVYWTTRPPLGARAVTVRYDGNARPQAWEMQVQAPPFTARQVAGEGAATVRTPAGEGLRPAAGSRLAQVLILPTPQGLRLLTLGFAAEQEPALLPAFRR